MKTQPIVPARVDFSDALAPQSPDYGDVYHSRAGAFGQAQHVFLAGNGLPERWRGRPRFVILETGFGLGNNFLATWAAWKADPQASAQLIFISIEKHPLSRDDLARAHASSGAPELAAQLIEAWPPLTPNLHQLDFEQGRVKLLLALGEARAWLSELVANVDAIYLDGFAPSRNPELWDRHTLKLLARFATPGTTASSWCVQGSVREALRAAGFELRKAPGFGNKWQMCKARYAPRFEPRAPAGRAALAAEAQEVLILGAGLAGAACAQALRRVGMRCRVIDAASAPAQRGSGNPGGLFHGTLNPDDGLHARFNRAAALRTRQWLAAGPALSWQQQGLLRLETRRSLAEMQAQIDRLGLPPDYVQALDAAAASALAGLPLQQPAWFYPGGGALPPAEQVRTLLGDTPLQSGAPVDRLQHSGNEWQLLDAQGQLIASTEALLLAPGADGLHLLQQLAPELPLRRQRGQLSRLEPQPGLPRPRLPVAGSGYAIAAPDGGLWCGATAQDDDEDAALRAEDQAHNLAQLSQLCGWPALGMPQALQGRVGWRLLAPDRLPLVGGLPDPTYTGRRDQVRLIPRLPGLVLCTALASRGIGWAALCAELAVAQLLGSPWPLEAGLADALDPARFSTRA
ncbi:FAD-dependent 5-carboxymethylaminomethyl-2-thiouridine(34) oxidoreductase MnmC [Paucibacter sp. APW11]|uniref:tRNA 5-methylaminomethyl-2-thiouridine biosynthesis bifunctional protein MnmC n=1 Tax=Roseateles aquae TaxID=3077235 RepID=A0ABU3P8P0_9BURK|nr:FAD-dependent 5-carboxymethylaminomethyl-2-thiouridine(34) oxidoreductase MnmC [Paucibacter sp. APW11]MDT8998934.1 FAD-dependent 5-carboxymethylaminomethyl-2-thiouridine(34) oxidoreductase MnmC [Paucibacter sp. APW11]